MRLVESVQKAGKTLQLLVSAVLLIVCAALVGSLILLRGANGASSTLSAGPTARPAATSQPSPGLLTMSGETIPASSVGGGSAQSAGGAPAQVEGNLGQTDAGGAPVQIEGSMPQKDQVTTVNQPEGWSFYTEDTFHFSISYPSNYAAQQLAASAAGNVSPVHAVSFRDKSVASSGTGVADLPAFSVEVFANGSGLSLDRWIDANDARPNSTRTPVTLGNAPAVKVELSTYIAPGQFYYVAQGKYVYRITPVGPFADQLLQSFKLL